MTDINNRCRNGKFFDRHGKCRRYPPKLFALDEAEILKFMRHLPDIAADEYCSEFEPKE